MSAYSWLPESPATASLTDNAVTQVEEKASSALDDKTHTSRFFDNHAHNSSLSPQNSPQVAKLSDSFEHSRRRRSISDSETTISLEFEIKQSQGDVDITKAKTVVNDKAAVIDKKESKLNFHPTTGRKASLSIRTATTIDKSTDNQSQLSPETSSMAKIYNKKQPRPYKKRTNPSKKESEVAKKRVRLDHNSMGNLGSNRKTHIVSAHANEQPESPQLTSPDTSMVVWKIHRPNSDEKQPRAVEGLFGSQVEKSNEKESVVDEGEEEMGSGNLMAVTTNIAPFTNIGLNLLAQCEIPDIRPTEHEQVADDGVAKLEKSIALDVEHLFRNVAAEDIARALKREARAILRPEHMEETKRFLATSRKASGSAIKQLMKSPYDLNLMKTCLDKQAELTAAKLKAQWLTSIERKWFHDKRLELILEEVKHPLKSFKSGLPDIWHYTTCFISRYFEARKEEYRSGKQRIEKNLSKVKELIENKIIFDLSERYGARTLTSDEVAELDEEQKEAHNTCTDAMNLMEIDYQFYEATYKYDLELNIGTIVPPMEIDMK